MKLKSIHKDLCTSTKWGLFQECKAGSISLNVTHYINRIRNKYHMIIFIDAGKAFDKIQHPFSYKCEKIILETLLNVIKHIYKSPIANFILILNSERLNSFPIK